MTDSKELLYQKVLSEVSHGVILLDSAQNILLWNNWIAHHSKIPSEKALGKNIYDIFPDMEKNLRLTMGLKWCLESGKYTLISERFGLSPLPLFSENGALINPRIILGPIQYEDKFYCCFEVYDSSSYLAKEQFARTQTEKLKNTQTTLVETSRLAALGEMAGGIAHEINTPLGVIVLRAGQIKRILENTPDSIDKVMEYSELIVSVCKRIESIIKGLRHFARSADNDPFIEYKISQIVQETIIFCAARLENHEIEIIIDKVSEDLQVYCRPVQISQVLLNLLSNSQHAVSQSAGKKWIHISFQEEENFVNLTLTDSGQGIPEQVAGKIFLPFFTTKELGVGTGLGLSISKGIMQEHGGDLILDKTAKNTSFIMKLPRNKKI